MLLLLLLPLLLPLLLLLLLLLLRSCDTHTGVGALLMLLPILVDGCCSILQVACSPTNLKRSRSSNTIMHIPGK
jgi:hypothetical protein